MEKRVLERLRKYPVDLIITDIRMPEMDGVEFLSQAYNLYSYIPVIVLTAYPEYQETISETHAMKFLVKPVTPEELRKAVDEVFSGFSKVKGFSLLNFLELIFMERKTCTIKVKKGFGNEGFLFFKEGQLIDAMVDDKKGYEAALEILTWDGVEIEIQYRCSVEKVSIDKDFREIALEAMVKKDEEKAKSKKGLVIEIFEKISNDIKGLFFISLMNAEGEVISYYPKNDKGLDFELFKNLVSVFNKISFCFSENIGRCPEVYFKGDKGWLYLIRLSNGNLLFLGFRKETLPSVRLILKNYERDFINVL